MHFGVGTLRCFEEGRVGLQFQPGQFRRAGIANLDLLACQGGDRGPDTASVGITEARGAFDVGDLVEGDQ